MAVVAGTPASYVLALYVRACVLPFQTTVWADHDWAMGFALYCIYHVLVFIGTHGFVSGAFEVATFDAATVEAYFIVQPTLALLVAVAASWIAACLKLPRHMTMVRHLIHSCGPWEHHRLHDEEPDGEGAIHLPPMSYALASLVLGLVAIAGAIVPYELMAFYEPYAQGDLVVLLVAICCPLFSGVVLLALQVLFQCPRDLYPRSKSRTLSVVLDALLLGVSSALMALSPALMAYYQYQPSPASEWVTFSILASVTVALALIAYFGVYMVRVDKPSANTKHGDTKPAKRYKMESRWMGYELRV